MGKEGIYRSDQGLKYDVITMIDESLLDPTKYKELAAIIKENCYYCWNIWVKTQRRHAENHFKNVQIRLKITRGFARQPLHLKKANERRLRCDVEVAAVF